MKYALLLALLFLLAEVLFIRFFKVIFPQILSELCSEDTHTISDHQRPRVTPSPEEEKCVGAKRAHCGYRREKGACRQGGRGDVLSGDGYGTLGMTTLGLSNGITSRTCNGRCGRLYRIGHAPQHCPCCTRGKTR